MCWRIRFVVIVAGLLSFGGWTGAQVFRFRPVDPPVVLSGSDLGFEITGHDGTRPIGALVVRIDGKWVRVKEAPAASGLATQ